MDYKIIFYRNNSNTTSLILIFFIIWICLINFQYYFQAVDGYFFKNIRTNNVSSNPRNNLHASRFSIARYNRVIAFRFLRNDIYLHTHSIQSAIFGKQSRGNTNPPSGRMKSRGGTLSNRQSPLFTVRS